MLEEFILLIEAEKDNVRKTLAPFVKEGIFDYYIGGFFDVSFKRFVAFAYIPIVRSMFYNYDYLFDLSNSGHSAIYLLPDTEEKTKKYSDDNTFQFKSTEELINEDIYKSLLISYTREFDFDEWNILPNYCFSDKIDKNILLESQLKRIKTTIKDHFLNNNLFQEASEHHEAFTKFARARYNQFPTAIPPNLKPFIGHTNLVALVRQKQASKLNLSFRDYIKTTVFEPLVIRLKIFYPIKYNNVQGLFAHECHLLIPSHRRFCLIMFLAIDIHQKSNICFFFYDLGQNKVFEWIYFQLYPHEQKSKGYDLI